jgi:NAD(P)-dependent dehydrogenase (short-subunit alcohol dehydrogenase family)
LLGQVHGNMDTIGTDNNMDNQSITGMGAIVTGAGRGIGRSIVLALAHRGARVTLAARTMSELEQVRTQIESFGGSAMCVPTDISSEPQVVRLVARAMQQWGRLDIVVNNAGIGVFGPLEQASAAQWDQVMAVNARGTFLMCREAIPHLRKQRPSYIVNVTLIHKSSRMNPNIQE